MLTEQTLQSLKDLLKKQISYLEQTIAASKDYIKVMYKHSTPDTTGGRQCFDRLNKERNCLRKDQKELQRLQKIQKAIKKDLALNVKIEQWAADARKYYDANGDYISVFEEESKKDDYQG